MDSPTPPSAPLPSPATPLDTAATPGTTATFELNTEPSGAAFGREPHWFIPSFGLAWFGIFVAITAPILGGLAVKVQGLVGLQAAGPQLGLILGAGALVSLISQPLAGRLSDHTYSRFGMRRPWILIGMIGTFISLVMVGLAPTVGTVLVAWCAAQLCSNFAQAAAFATVADQVPDRRRGLVSGVQGAAGPLAILAGAVGLSALPTDFLRFLVPAAIGLVLSVVFVFTFRDRVLRREERLPLSLRTLLGSFFFNPRKDPNFAWAWLVKAMFMFGAASLATYLALFLGTSFGMTNPRDQLNFILLATLVSTVATVIFSLIGGPLSDRLDRRRELVALGAIMLGIGLGLVAIAPLLDREAGLALLLVAEAIIGAGSGLFNAVDTALVLRVLPNRGNLAKDLGIMNIANTLPQSVAPFMAGVMIIPLGNTLTGGNGYVIWFFFAALVAIVAGLLVFKIKGIR